jgi:hypothetical protein
MASPRPAEIPVEDARVRRSGDLPVLAIGRSALALPYKNLPHLVRLGALSILLAIGLELVWKMLESYGILRNAPGFYMLGLIVAYTPFEVGWIRLVINGPDDVADRRYFTFGRTDGLYLLATCLFVAAFLSIFIPVSIMYYGQRNLDRHLVIDGAVHTVAAFVAFPIYAVRLLYIFPEVATGVYRGVAAVWRQTKGSFEGLLALEVWRTRLILL